MVTLSGESFASRMAARLLRAIGADAGITESLDQYVEAAVALATQPELLARYRSVFTEANWAATIGDIATFTFHYEESLIQIELALRTRPAVMAGTEMDGAEVPREVPEETGSPRRRRPDPLMSDRPQPDGAPPDPRAPDPRAIVAGQYTVDPSRRLPDAAAVFPRTPPPAGGASSRR